VALRPVRARSWRVEDCVSEERAVEAFEADGRWRRVGSVMVERVYERPCEGVLVCRREGRYHHW